MAAEFEDNYGGENIDVDVTTRVMTHKHTKRIEVSVILTKVQTVDDFVDISTSDYREIEAFFRQVREAEVEYRRLTQSDRL